jgi:hypothetical protein
MLTGWLSLSTEPFKSGLAQLSILPEFPSEPTFVMSKYGFRKYTLGRR